MAIVSQNVQKLLIDEGLVPKDCRSVTLEIPATGAVIIRYEVFFNIETAEKWARIFLALATEPR